MSQVLRVAWYRFRATFGYRWGGYLSMVLLIGIIDVMKKRCVASA